MVDTCMKFLPLRYHPYILPLRGLVTLRTLGIRKNVSYTAADSAPNFLFSINLSNGSRLTLLGEGLQEGYWMRDFLLGRSGDLETLLLVWLFTIIIQK